MPNHLQLEMSDVTENTHVSTAETSPTLSADDLAPLKSIHNAHAGKGKHLRGKAATDVQQVYERALSVAPDAVRQYLESRDIDDGASEASDATMELTSDDDDTPASPGTGCGPCRQNLAGTDWRTRMENVESGRPAVPDPVVTTAPAPATQPCVAARAPPPPAPARAAAQTENCESPEERATAPVETIFKRLEECCGHALYRRITYKVANGQKVPTGENNKDSPAQIAERRGSGPVLSLYQRCQGAHM